MKNKLIITLLILLALISCILLYSCKKQEPIEPMPTVEPIAEETTVEIETTTEEVETTTEQGTVEGYTSETEAEVLTGDEISLEDIPDDIKQLEEEINNQLQLNENGKPISSYAGTTSKHDWTYPDDYSEKGNRFIDRRGHIERRFDKGLMTEGQYKDAIEFLEKVQGDADDYDGEGATMEDAAKAIAEATKPDTGEGSTTPGGGGDPIELPKSGKVIVPDGRICY